MKVNDILKVVPIYKQQQSFNNEESFNKYLYEAFGKKNNKKRDKTENQNSDFKTEFENAKSKFEIRI